MLQFEQIYWLYAGILSIPLLVLFFWRTEKVARRKMSRFAATGLLAKLTAHYSPRRMWIKYGLIIVSIFLFFTSLSRPQFGYELEEREISASDVLIALDTSRSMLAQDLSPNRLERAKLAIRDLVDELEGDRIGLIAFSGTAFLQCPLTLDYAAFLETLNSLEVGIIPRGGTDVAAAINEARDYLELEGRQKNLFLITDGEDLEAQGFQAAKDAKENNITIHTIGLGDPSGELIPVTQPDGTIDYVKDTEGNPVKTSLDESALRQIAQTTDGQYRRLNATGQPLIELYQNEIAVLETGESKSEIQQIPIERFTIPLLIGVILLLFESLIPSRRRKSLSNASSLLFVGMISMLGTSHQVEAQSWKAAKAFKDGNIKQSVELYEEVLAEDPDQPKIQYNFGVSLYENGDYAEAAQAFRNAIKSESPEIQADSFYNLGNALYRSGFNLLDSDSPKTLELWNEAVSSYQNSAEILPDYQDTQTNIDLIERQVADLTFNLTTTAAPVEGGSISQEAESAFYKVPVKVKASPNEGWRFDQWQGLDEEAETSKPSITVELSSDLDLTANFIKQWELTVKSSDPNKGSAGESGIYDANTPVDLKAEAEDYFAFDRWSGTGGKIENEKAAETTITLDSDIVATAYFVPAFKLDVKSDPEIGAKVTESGFYEEFSEVPLVAQPRDGFIWEQWNGEVKDETAEETSIFLSEDREVIAQLKRIWNLVLIPVTDEGGSTEGGGEYPIGTVVDISATPNEGYEFSHWEGPAVEDPESANTTVTVQSGEHDLFAHFTQDDSDQDQQDQNQDQQDQDQEDQNDQQNQDQQDQQDQDSSQNEDSEEQNSEDGEDQDQQEDEDNNSAEEDGSQEQEESGEEEQAENEEGEPEDQSGEEQNAGEEQTSAQRVSGQLTQEEARQLLNALEEGNLILPTDSENQNRNQGPVIKDW